MKKINKVQARKLFNNGEEIMFAPSKYNINSKWGVNMTINKNDIDCDFDTFVDRYEIMNCNSELGYNVAYYIKEDK